MKRILTIVAITLALATNVFATQAYIGACTADGKPAALKVEIVDNASKEVADNVGNAFRAAASALPADKLVLIDGFKLFYAGLSEEAKQSISLPYPPIVDVKGSCKVAAQKDKK